jgi:hypothetical protein
MTRELIPSPLLPARAGEFPVPAIIASAGDKASEYFLEFFAAATIRNKNTRAAYVQAIAQFCRWCEDHDLRLSTIRPLHVSAYIEGKPLTAPSIKQHLAALRGLFNWLVIKQVVPENPAMFVKGPKFSRTVGITPIMEAGQMRQLLDSIPITRKITVSKKHGGGRRKSRTSRDCATAPSSPSWRTPSRASAPLWRKTRRLPAGGKACPAAPAGKRQ